MPTHEDYPWERDRSVLHQRRRRLGVGAGPARVDTSVRSRAAPVRFGVARILGWGLLVILVCVVLRLVVLAL